MLTHFKHVHVQPQLMVTQLFSSFIQRRMEASDPHILFFDVCLAHAQGWETQQQLQQQLQQQQQSSELTVPGNGTSSPSPSSRRPAPAHRLLIDRVESLGLAASPSSSRLNGGSPSALLLSRSSSLASSSSSYARLFPLPSPPKPFADAMEDEDSPPAPPRFAGLLRKMSSSISLTRLPSLKEESAAVAAMTAAGSGEGEAEEKSGEPTRAPASAAAGSGGHVECRPSTEGLPEGERYSYCDHGFLAWPQWLDERCVKCICLFNRLFIFKLSSNDDVHMPTPPHAHAPGADAR
jgi:hypothetical protein